MLPVTIAQEQPVVEFLGIANRRGDLVRAVPGNVVELDRLFPGREAVATDLQRIEDCRTTDGIADHLVQSSPIGMRDSFRRGLHGRQARQIARRALSMHVLAILISSLQSRDQRDVVSVLGQWLYGRGQLQRRDTRQVGDALLLLRLVRIEPADETRQFGVLFAGEETPANDPVRDVHDHELLARRGRDRGRGLVIPNRQRVQERQRQHRPIGFQKLSSGKVHEFFSGIENQGC